MIYIYIILYIYIIHINLTRAGSPADGRYFLGVWTHPSIYLQSVPVWFVWNYPTNPSKSMIYHGLVTFGFLLFLEGYFFFAAGFGLFLGFLVLCFPVSLLFFFSAFPASLLFCFSVFPASLLLYFCAFLLLLLYFFFSSVMCFCCSTSCSLLLYFLSLLSLCFLFSFALFCSVCILN